jgi:acyl dehydratase
MPTPTSDTPPIGPAARFYEDFAVGDRFTTQGRTVSETELTLWAMFSGDMNPMHVDEEFARVHGLFGGRFPPGLLAVGVASGLVERLGFFAGTGLAIKRQSIVYRSPVLVGDTIHVELDVTETAPHPRRPAGHVTFAYRIAKHDGTTCIEGDWEWLIAAGRRPLTQPAPR